MEATLEKQALSLDDSMAMFKTRNAEDALSQGGFTSNDTNKTTADLRYDNGFYGKVYPYVEKFYPSYNYWNHYKEDSVIERAFKLVQVLIDKKFVKEPKTVKDFIVLVNTLADEL